MKKVLILGVAAVQYEAIKELNNMGVETHAVAQKNDGPGAGEAHKFTEINILDTDKLENYILANQIDAVYSTGSDLAMPIISFLSEKLDLPHFVSERTAQICNNKNLMRKELGNSFHGNVPFQILENKYENIELEYPFIMKPTDSQGQRGVELITNYEEFLNKFDDIKGYTRSGLVIIEKYIKGPEISVNGYVVNGRIAYLESTDRETWEKYIGLIHKHIVPASALDEDSNEELLEIMNKLVEKLSIQNGPIYAQVKVENNHPYIIEVTPRLDGCHMWNVLSRYNNVNLMKLTLNHLLNEDTSELENRISNVRSQELEFICQEPNTPADYTQYERMIQDSDESYLYYQQGQTIKPVNGKFEKIGYIINRVEEV